MLAIAGDNAAGSGRETLLVSFDLEKRFVRKGAQTSWIAFERLTASIRSTKSVLALPEVRSDTCDRSGLVSWKYQHPGGPLHDINWGLMSLTTGRLVVWNELTIICASNHHDPIVPFQAIYLIEKKALDAVGYQTIDVLKDQKAWADIPGFLENFTDVIVVCRPP